MDNWNEWIIKTSKGDINVYGKTLKEAFEGREEEIARMCARSEMIRIRSAELSKIEYDENIFGDGGRACIYLNCRVSNTQAEGSEGYREYNKQYKVFTKTHEDLTPRADTTPPKERHFICENGEWVEIFQAEENDNSIKKICDDYEITQTELSKMFSIPLRTVQDWCAGKRKPPEYVTKMINELLKINKGA